MLKMALAKSGLTAPMYLLLSMPKSTPLQPIDIKAIPVALKQLLEQTAWERGLTLSAFLRKHLKQWVRLGHQPITQPRKLTIEGESSSARLRIKNLHCEVKKALEQESKRRGLHLSDLLKAHLWQWAEAGCPNMATEQALKP